MLVGGGLLLQPAWPNWTNPKAPTIPLPLINDKRSGMIVNGASDIPMKGRES